PPPSFPNDVTVDTWLDKHLSSLTTLLKAHTPLKRPTARSKPWWSKELTHLRQNFHRTARTHRRDPSPSSLSETRTTKGAYFKAIKSAKAAHWKAFPSTVHPPTPPLPPHPPPPLLALRSHPPSPQRANGLVRPTPGRPDYPSLRSYRIRVRLDTVPRLLERILATRLPLRARTVGALDP